MLVDERQESGPIRQRKSEKCGLGCQGLRKDVSECLPTGDSELNSVAEDVVLNWKIQVWTPKKAGHVLTVRFFGRPVGACVKFGISQLGIRVGGEGYDGLT